MVNNLNDHFAVPEPSIVQNESSHKHTMTTVLLCSWFYYSVHALSKVFEPLTTYDEVARSLNA